MNYMNFLKNKKTKKILSIFLAIILILGLFLAGYGYYQLNKIKITKISKSNEDLGINTDTENDQKVEMDDDIVNIALFGTDRRSKEERARTDTIMIATIDKKHRKIKLSSIMRDSYVNINGHGMDKITHAYFFGGPQLAIRTINENFKMDIRDFVLVDFFSLEKIIDALGGLVVDVKDYEVKSLNECVKESAALQNVKPHYVTSGGVQLLDGMQAVAYGRIRNVGNGDYERTDRQRLILSLILDKISDAGSLKFPYIVSQMLPYVETSMDKSTMLKLGSQVFAGNMMNIEQQRFPLIKASRDMTIGGVYYLWLDIDATAKHIHEFIYDDVIPEVKSSDEISTPPSSSSTKNKKTTSTSKKTTSSSKKTTSSTSTSKKTNTQTNNLNTNNEVNTQNNNNETTNTEIKKTTESTNNTLKEEPVDNTNSLEQNPDTNSGTTSETKTP